MPILPGLKLETSEAPSLSTIPAADSQSLDAARGGMLNSKRFSRREIDFKSLLPEKIMKVNKQAMIDAELKEAISALKKPNRELAGKSLAETSEKRLISSSARKSKKPIRNPLFQGVQISATPKTKRQKDVFSESQQQSLEPMVGEVSMIPKSSASRAPQSASRSAHGGMQCNPLFSSVQATPTKRVIPAFPQRPVNEVDCAGIPSSPLHFRRSSAQLFTTVSDSPVKNSDIISYGIDETPVKKRPASSLENSHPRLTGVGSDKENYQSVVTSVATSERKGVLGEDDSIYKALGWDSDMDDLD